MDPDSTARRSLLRTVKQRVWTAAIWSWPVCLIGVALSFILIGGFVPPPHPSWTAQEIGDFFLSDATNKRIGAIGFLYFSGLTIFFYSVISEEIKKIEGEPALLARVQMGSAVILVTVFQFIGMNWLLCTYRPEISAEIIRALNDYCWFMWSMFIPTYMIQYICLAIAGFADERPNPTWPRWAAYMNLWIAVIGAGGFFAVFFKDGPFAWNGVIGFWIPVAIYAIGNCINSALMLKRHKLERAGLT